MKTGIEIENSLLADALKATGLKIQGEVVEFALRTLIQLKQQESIKSLRGKLAWDGNLKEMRTNS
jgi:Arc/MetJ family transcription regulator